MSNNPYARHDDEALVRRLRQAANERCHPITLDLANDLARRLRDASLTRMNLEIARDRIAYLEQFVSDEVKNPPPAAPAYQPTSRNE